MFRYTVLPLAKPALAAQAIFVFMTSWNNFLLPVVILFDPEMFTLPALGIYAFFNRYFIQSPTCKGGKG